MCVVQVRNLASNSENIKFLDIFAKTPTYGIISDSLLLVKAVMTLDTIGKMQSKLEATVTVVFS